MTHFQIAGSAPTFTLQTTATVPPAGTYYVCVRAAQSGMASLNQEFTIVGSAASQTLGATTLACPSSCLFVPGTPQVVGTLSTVMIPSQPGFAGSYNLVSSGCTDQGDTTNFSLGGAGNATVNTTAPAAGTYHICVQTSQPSAGPSKYTEFTITGTTQLQATVINANNPASMATIQDSFGATWSFDKTAPLCSGCFAPDLEGNWPVLRNGVLTNPPTIGNFKEPGTNYGAFQLETIPGDPNLYAYDLRNFEWFNWDGSAWHIYTDPCNPGVPGPVQGSTTPPGQCNKTAIPMTMQLSQWAYSTGFAPFSTAFLGRLPNGVGGQPSCDICGWGVDSNTWGGEPGIPGNAGWGTVLVNINGSPSDGGPHANYMGGVNGTAGNTYFTFTTLAAINGAQGWATSQINPGWQIWFSEWNGALACCASVGSITGPTAGVYTINLVDSRDGTPYPLASTISSAAYHSAFTGSISGTTLTITAISSGNGPRVGDGLFAAGIPSGQVKVTSGGPGLGNYQVEVNVGTIPSEAMTSEAIYHIQGPVEWDAIAAGTWDSSISNIITTYLRPDANMLYYIRIEGEWCCGWEYFSPWQQDAFIAYVSPARWSTAVAHELKMLQALLRDCGVANGCNPNLKFDIDGPARLNMIPYLEYTGPGVPVSIADLVDAFSLDDYVYTQGPPSSANIYIDQFSNSQRQMVTGFAAKHNKAIFWTEWCDGSRSPWEHNNKLLTWQYNLFASIQGPGNTHFRENMQVNTDQEACNMGNDSFKMVAMDRLWPNGFGNSHYDGSYYPELPVASINPWNGTSTTAVGVTGITLDHTAATRPNTATIPSGNGNLVAVTNPLATATIPTNNGTVVNEGITTSDEDLFLVYNLSVYQARNFTPSDIGTHVTHICVQFRPTVCTDFTLTIN